MNDDELIRRIIKLHSIITRLRGVQDDEKYIKGKSK